MAASTPFPYIVLAAGISGFLIHRSNSALLFGLAHDAEDAKQGAIAGTIAADFDANPPPHTQPNNARLMRVILTSNLRFLIASGRDGENVILTTKDRNFDCKIVKTDP